jgi:hypothetical protein
MTIMTYRENIGAQFPVGGNVVGHRKPSVQKSIVTPSVG